MKTIDITNQPKTISREKISQYIYNKNKRLSEEGYQHAMSDIYNDVSYGDKESYNEEDLHELNQKILQILPRDQLKGEHATIPDYLALGTKSDFVRTIIKKINDRSMTEIEYKKIMSQIEKFDSILPDTNRRERAYGGGSGSLILSLTTGKIYDVESSEGNQALMNDYVGKQYYSSRSGASGAGYLYAGKTSLVYLPSMRMDVAHPGSEGYFQDVNGLNMTVLTTRGKVHENLSTVIKNCAGVDIVLLSQKDHLSSEGSGKFLGEAITTKGASLEQLPIKTFTTEYYDENFEKKTLSFTYRTNMDSKDISFNDIGKYFLDIKRGFDIESTGKFIDNKIGLRKYKDKYVRLGTFGLIKEVFDEYPIKAPDEKLYYEDIEVGPSNIIEHIKREIPLSNDYTADINGREVSDHLAVRQNKHPISINGSIFEKICKDHSMDPETLVEGFDRYCTITSYNAYSLIYERKLSDLYPEFDKFPTTYMEYEADIPAAVFERYPRSYRENHMKEKLMEKALDELENVDRRSTEQQKQMVIDYLYDNLTKKFVVQDSYATGNCEPGTADFIKAYRLPESGISADDLTKHPRFEQMLEVDRFRAVILKKVRDEIFDVVL